MGSHRIQVGAKRATGITPIVSANVGDAVNADLVETSSRRNSG
jgi:hypothetical protein